MVEEKFNKVEGYMLWRRQWWIVIVMGEVNDTVPW